MNILTKKPKILDIDFHEKDYPQSNIDLLKMINESIKFDNKIDNGYSLLYSNHIKIVCETMLIFNYDFKEFLYILKDNKSLGSTFTYAFYEIKNINQEGCVSLIKSAINRQSFESIKISMSTYYEHIVTIIESKKDDIIVEADVGKISIFFQNFLSTKEEPRDEHQSNNDILCKTKALNPICEKILLEMNINSKLLNNTIKKQKI